MNFVRPQGNSAAPLRDKALRLSQRWVPLMVVPCAGGKNCGMEVHARLDPSAQETAGKPLPEACFERRKVYFDSLSRARLSSRTLTRGSPRKPSWRPAVCCAKARGPSLRTGRGALATLGAW